MTPTKDGRCWYFRIYKNGKQFNSKKYFTKKEAQDEEALAIIKRDNPLNKSFNLILDSFIKEIENTSKYLTFLSKKRDLNAHVRPFFKDYNINKINTQIICDWADYLNKKNLALITKNKIKSELKQVFDHAIKYYGLETNPVVNFGAFKEKNDKVISDSEKIRYITKEEFNKFISVIDNNLWYTFFYFLYYTGCRLGEVRALTWNDIDFNTSTIEINKTLISQNLNEIKINSPKTNANRKILMSKHLKELLLNYKHEMEKYSNYNENWFIFGNIFPLTRESIRRTKNKYFELSGVNEITIHEFRHSHVSLLINEYLKSGQTDTTKFFIMMSSRMGHTIATMQKTYLHLFPTIQNEIVDLLDNL